MARCPKCVSLKIHCELLFDSYQLACKDCGHSEMFETWPEPDSDDHWYS